MLTVADLHDTLTHEDHLGWGYACVASIDSDAVRARIDRHIVRAANDLGLTADELFMWSNSKYGRWLSDEVGESLRDATLAKVQRYLSAETIATLKRYEGIA
jgi:hypothetical protein